jgi:integrase
LAGYFAVACFCDSLLLVRAGEFVLFVSAVGKPVPGSKIAFGRLYGTHSLRRTKATLIYRRTGKLRAVQLLVGHTKVESTVQYLGIDVDDALAS